MYVFLGFSLWCLFWDKRLHNLNIWFPNFRRKAVFPKGRGEVPSDTLHRVSGKKHRLTYMVQRIFGQEISALFSRIFFENFNWTIL